jgi:cytochrome c oxidase subunit 2
MQTLPDGATTQAEALHHTWMVFLGTGLAVAAVVYALILWCLLRYRKPKDATEYPPQFRTNKRLEIVYTIIPVIIVIALFLLTYKVENDVETLSPRTTVQVNVIAYRWSWRFVYPQLGVAISGTPQKPPTLVLPAMETTRLNISSVDVDHSFWVPAFLFKRDAIPGFANAFDWTPKQLGTYRGECGEFCGLYHEKMSFTVRIVSPSDFTRWVRVHHS